MQAAIFRAYGGPDVIELSELPEPVLHYADQVLLAVHAVALNPLDSKIRRGELGLLAQQRWPGRLGHDVYATVLACGAEVSHLQVGDKVAGFIDRNHRPSLMGFVRGGALAQRLVVRANTLCRVPAGSTAEVAALGLAGQTAWQALRDKARLLPGQSILINGAAGGVGSMAVQLAHSIGAKVTAVARAGQREWLLGLGADGVLDYTTERVLGDVRYSVIYDVAGVLSPAQVKNCLQPGGIFISNLPTPGRLLRAAVGSLLPGLLPRFAVVWVKPDYQAMQSLLALYALGQIKPAVSASFAWQDVQAAFDYMESPRSVGKTLVWVDPQAEGW